MINLKRETPEAVGGAWDNIILMQSDDDNPGLRVHEYTHILQKTRLGEPDASIMYRKYPSWDLNPFEWEANYWRYIYEGLIDNRNDAIVIWGDPYPFIY